MHKPTVFLAIILITGNLTQVKAGQDNASTKLKAKNREKSDKTTKVQAMTLDNLIQKVLKEGESRTVKGPIAKNLGFLETKNTRDVDVQAADSEDGWSRQVFIPLERSEEDEKPLAVIFFKKKKDREKLLSESHYFKLNMNEKLELVLGQTGKYDEDMKPIPGSAKVTFPDIDSLSVREGLEREMDFWLKGMYRKPPAEESAASEESAKPKVSDKEPAKPASPSKTDQPKQ